MRMRKSLVLLVIGAALLTVLAACASTSGGGEPGACATPDMRAELPDPNLRAAVAESLGKSDVTCGDLAAIGALRAFDVGVESLEGLQHATSLVQLHMQVGAVSDLSPLEDLRLRDLALSGNAITDLSPLRGMTSLEQLRVTNNPDLVDLSPLAGLPALELLHVFNTAVTDLSVATELPAMRDLAFRSPLDDHAVITRVPNLTTLTVYDLPVADLPLLEEIDGLRALSLYGHLGRYEDVSFLARLTQIDELATNKLPQWDDLTVIGGMTNLKVLRLNLNFVSDLTPLLALADLTTLDVRNNCLPAAMEDEPTAMALEARGVSIQYLPQRTSGC